MTPSELKQRYYESNPDGHFFDRETMKFFGDTMRNYGTRTVTVEHRGELVEAVELYRKRPVKHGLKDSKFFDFDGNELIGVNRLERDEL